MRARLMAHPEYKADSEVSAGMTYDLLRACSEVTVTVWFRARVSGRVMVRVRVRVRVRARVRRRVGARSGLLALTLTRYPKVGKARPTFSVSIGCAHSRWSTRGTRP